MPKDNSLKLELALAAQEAVRVISEAAAKATATISQAAEAATKVVANNAATAAQTLVVQNKDGVSDHEVLSTFVATTTLSFANLDTKFTEQFADIKNDIAKISDGASSQSADHEIRIKALETSKTRQNVMMSIGIGLLTLLASLLIYALFHVKL
jgi:hypothetical protein